MAGDVAKPKEEPKSWSQTIRDPKTGELVKEEVKKEGK